MDVFILATAISNITIQCCVLLLHEIFCLFPFAHQLIHRNIQPLVFQWISPPNHIALSNNCNIIKCFKKTCNKLGKNALISVRSSLDFTLGKLSLGNGQVHFNGCVFPSHLLYVSKGENRVISRLCYLMNIGKNLVKNPNNLKKKAISCGQGWCTFGTGFWVWHREAEERDRGCGSQEGVMLVPEGWNC